MSPNGEGIKVALEAMRSDAALWRAQADAMNEPKQELESLKLDVTDVGYFASQKGLETKFEEVRTKVGDLLSGGQEYFTKLGSELDAAASQYQADDEAGKHQLEQTQ